DAEPARDPRKRAQRRCRLVALHLAEEADRQPGRLAERLQGHVQLAATRADQRPDTRLSRLLGRALMLRDIHRPARSIKIFLIQAKLFVLSKPEISEARVFPVG